MTDATRTILVCSCEDTMSPDLAAIARGCPGARIEAGRDFCRSQIDRAKALAATDTPLTVACTAQRPLFEEVFEETGRQAAVSYGNIRELAGWSDEGTRAGPKMAALLALAAEPPADVPVVTLESEGVCIIYGRDEGAIEAARTLANDLDLTVLLSRPGDIAPPDGAEFPIFRGTIRSARGHIGAFELGVDDFAAPSPASRGALRFGTPRNGATSNCDLIIDLSGGKPLFAADDLRDGYLRADPRDPLAVAGVLAKARDLVGTFDKPRYITFKPDLCAHSRNRITGCTRCLDVCPTGAITPDGDAVAIDPAICAGCGSCAALCPTGAASYALPSADTLMRRVRTLLSSYHAAGGSDAVLLLHDGDHGTALLHALAHFGDGLPARVLPLPVNEMTQIGVETLAAAFAYGAGAVRLLTREKPRHDETALHRTIDLARVILEGLGFDQQSVGVLATDDPDRLGADLRAVPASAPRRIATFLPQGPKRQVQRLALRELHAVAPAPVERIMLEAGAPFGAVTLKSEACTLCLSCVSACPADALTANPDRPELRFAEDLCVQCGVCQKTCPEQAIMLAPRLDFVAIEAPPVSLKAEEPHACDRCGKLFGTRATIARIREKLAGKHWMFAGDNADRVGLIGLCDDCRVAVATENRLDPYAGPQRPRPRTAEDYLKEREADLRRAETEGKH